MFSLALNLSTGAPIRSTSDRCRPRRFRAASRRSPSPEAAQAVLSLCLPAEAASFPTASLAAAMAFVSIPARASRDNRFCRRSLECGGLPPLFLLAVDHFRSKLPISLPRVSRVTDLRQGAEKREQAPALQIRLRNRLSVYASSQLSGKRSGRAACYPRCAKF